MNKPIIKFMEPDSIDWEVCGTGKEFDGHHVKIVYYYKNQSRLFSNPNVYIASNKADFEQAVRIAKKNGYEIVEVEIS